MSCASFGARCRSVEEFKPVRTRADAGAHALLRPRVRFVCVQSLRLTASAPSSLLRCAPSS